MVRKWGKRVSVGLYQKCHIFVSINILFKLKLFFRNNSVFAPWIGCLGYKNPGSRLPGVLLLKRDVRLLQNDFHAAVLWLAHARAGWDQKMRFAKGLDFNLGSRNAVRDKLGGNRFRAAQ